MLYKHLPAKEGAIYIYNLNIIGESYSPNQSEDYLSDHVKFKRLRPKF